MFHQSADNPIKTRLNVPYKNILTPDFYPFSERIEQKIYWIDIFIYLLGYLFRRVCLLNAEIRYVLLEMACYIYYITKYSNKWIKRNYHYQP